MVFSVITNGPRGLIPVKATSGYPQRSNQYQTDGTGSDNFFTGQALKIDDNGLVVKLAAAADTVLGVFSGVEYVRTNGDVIFLPFWDKPGAVQTGSQVRCTIYDDPFGLFQIFADADLVVGRNAAFFDFDTVAGTGGSTVTGQSSISLDVSSDSTTPAGKTLALRNFDVQKGRPGDLRTALVQFVDPEYAGEIGAT